MSRAMERPSPAPWPGRPVTMDLAGLCLHTVQLAGPLLEEAGGALGLMSSASGVVPLAGEGQVVPRPLLKQGGQLPGTGRAARPPECPHWPSADRRTAGVTRPAGRSHGRGSSISQCSLLAVFGPVRQHFQWLGCTKCLVKCYSQYIKFFHPLQ